MEPILFFFENASIVIAVMYLSYKIKERFIHQITIIGTDWIYALFFTILTLSVMINPYEFQGMRLDLREAPLFLAGFVGGWKVGILSAIIPGIFRWSLGGPTVLEGLLQAFALPVLVGSLFHNKKNLQSSPYSLINIRRMLLFFLLYELLKSLWMVWSTPATVWIVLLMSAFASVAALGISAMLNDFNRTVISRMELEFYSNHDPMTGLPNMRYFTNRVNKMIKDQVPIVITMFDVDYFKQYNDTNGHQAGDEVLKGIAKILQKNIRTGDIVGRYGGEEFIICFTNISDIEEVSKLSDKLRKDVESYRFENESCQPFGDITISIGVSRLVRGESLEKLIGEADNALYTAKQNGRNQICYS